MATNTRSFYNLKDKKAQIYRRISSTDSHGYPVHKYYPIAAAPLWCYTRQLTQEQIYTAHSYGEQETRLFVFNYYGSVIVGDHVIYKNTWYTITRVDTQDDYKGDMFIYVKLASGSFKPADINPYTPEVWN